ncbi:hypothetical protein BDQ94DRAFT_139177 [Aspergillus welwitschiae]|uniref:Uncharacterized protein n=1 Tax=Aspergillus welwitschiae TaxID=1341132 RepID=A0A3F3Q962_9EURO|nr:hypothetical protein BDQ94DRAFT_139177 [Aspergillus welwitschiae]RDH35751.1 hypothetical protein BDQ94DRAFT_139177 [Aspergillus welwitschiae]
MYHRLKVVCSIISHESIAKEITKGILRFYPASIYTDNKGICARVHDPKRHLPWISCQAADHPRRDRLVGAGLRSIGIMDVALHRHRLGFSPSPLPLFRHNCGFLCL